MNDPEQRPGEHVTSVDLSAGDAEEVQQVQQWLDAHPELGLTIDELLADPTAGGRLLYRSRPGRTYEPRDDTNQ